MIEKNYAGGKNLHLDKFGFLSLNFRFWILDFG